jgi:hypothetical protein
MLAFVTTIRHPHNAVSYQRVGHLLDATLRSIVRQTSTAFVIVVVHNELPTFELADARISTVKVDFPAPSTANTPRIPFDLFQRDKGTKCVVGLTMARDLGADHVMFFDADDLIHHRIAERANADLSHPGWYSAQGYIHTHGSRTIQFVEEDFHRKNGSSGIVRTDLAGVPDGLSVASTQSEILEAMSAPYVDVMFGQHGHWQEHLAPLGYVVEPLPFPAAIWEIGTGENLSGNLVSSRAARPITADIELAFGLARPSVGSHARARVTMTAQRLGRRLERARQN